MTTLAGAGAAAITGARRMGAGRRGLTASSAGNGDAASLLSGVDAWLETGEV